MNADPPEKPTKINIVISGFVIVGDKMPVIKLLLTDEVDLRTTA